MTAEWKSHQGTVQEVVPRKVMTDEGTSYGFLNYLNRAAINTQVVFQPIFERGRPEDLTSIALSWKSSR